MKNLRRIIRLLLASGLVLAASCTALTRSTVVRYRADGTVESREETSESLVKTLAATHTVVISESGWGVRLSAQAQGESSMLPGLVLKAGKLNACTAFIHKDQRRLAEIAQMVGAAQYGVTITASGASDAPKAAAQPAQSKE